MRRLVPPLLLLALAWLVTTGAVGACDLFRPAVPESGGGGVVVLTNYSDPDSTLATMARGIAAKAEGRDAYMGGIADPVRDSHSFEATFDPAVLARYNSQPGALPVPAPWSSKEEATFFSSFSQYKTTPYAMVWGPDNANPIDDTGDPRVIHRSYQVTTQLSDGTNVIHMIIAVGFADLTFTQTPSGRWIILRWQDRVDPAFGGANPSNPEQVTLGWRRLTLPR